MTTEHPTADQSVKCKGFWNFCACDKCRAADRALETKIRDPQKRELAIAECAANRGVKIDDR